MRAPTLQEACERAALTLLTHPADPSVSVAREDLVALCAAAGWTMTVDEAREDAAPEMDQPMFGAI